MKKNAYKIVYSVSAVLGVLIIGASIVSAFDIPLNSGPIANGFRGQVKQGKLTIGSTGPGQGQLNVVGTTGLKVQKANCNAVPFTGANAWPCPTTVALGPELRVLQLGYTYKMVVGGNAGTPPTPQTMLDVIGGIKVTPQSMNYATGAPFPGSSANKPLCALPDGQIAVCGTTGSCGADHLASLNATPTQLCNLGTASTVTTTNMNTQWNWTCTQGTNPPTQCVAYRAVSTSGPGGGINTGGGINGGTPINTNPGGNFNGGGIVPVQNGGGIIPVGPSGNNQLGG